MACYDTGARRIRTFLPLFNIIISMTEKLFPP